MKRQLLEMEAESFVCCSIRDWTRATQVICHPLMELINGGWVEGGSLLPTTTRPALGSLRGLCYKVIFFSEMGALFHRLFVASECRKVVGLTLMLI